ncbi:hypothetical protein SteCoe_29058 [Stentor coeruleus]|uniref:Ral GTPase-activating protein subunit alpha/beta N-terminal domain-containing protein n=1 Tax=Stentor coeruleus TaxID=5963 RepID=A0A1R2B6R0_9CILI|nr:hypothetical protein SteCoe_29058 [Stentor coeruleus]
MYLSNFTPEEFQRQSDEPYIKKRYSTNLLNDILTEPKSRTIVVENFVQDLSIQGFKCLKTEFHLNWAMECLGYSFSLPPRKFFNTIMNSIEIYKEWLLNPILAPPFLQNNLGYYQREILCHFSLAFLQQNESLKQVDVCLEILKIICEFINSKNLEQETLLCLLKLLFKMTEEVLKNIRIAELLSQQTLKILFQVWLLSNTRDKQLWEDLDKMMYNYIDNPWVIISWNNVVLGLTKRVVNVLYGKFDKQFIVKFYEHESLNEAQMIFAPKVDNEQVLYFWYRLLRIFLSNKNYQDKSLDSRVALIIGINKVINQFLKACDLYNKNIKPKGTANKEMILCNQTPLSLQDYYKLLSSIFIHESKVGFSSSLQDSSLASKNNPIKDYLAIRDRIPIPSISGIFELFGSWLFGITKHNSIYTELERAEAIGMICKILARAKGPASQFDLEKFSIRMFYEILKKNLKTCNEIIINFSGLPKTNIKIIELILENFSFLQFIIDTLNENHLEIETKRHCFEIFLIFSNISEIYLGHKLANNLASIFLIHLADRDENSLLLLTWIICSYVTCLDNDSGTINSLLRGLVNRLGSLEENSRINYFALLNCIGMIPYLIDRSKPSIDVIKTNVKIMLSLIPHKGKSNEETVCRLLLCITDWIIAFPPVFFDQEIKSQMLKKLDYTKIYDKYPNFNDFLKELLLNAFNQPESIGLWSRKQDLNMRKDLFNTEHAVFTAEEMDNYVILHIKNHIGSYIWKITEVRDRMQKKSLNLQMTNLNIITQEIQYQKHPNTQVNTEEYLGNDFSSFQTIKKYFDKQKQIQTDFKNNSKTKPIFYKDIKNRKTTETEESNIDSAKFKIFRRFVSELGYLDINTLNMIHPQNKASKSLFQKIDMQSIKPLVIFPVIYLPTPDAQENIYLSSSAYYSEEFQEFLKSFGTLITGQGEYPYYCNPQLMRFRSCLFKSHAFLRSVVVSPALCQYDIKITLNEILDKYKNIVIWNERHNDRYSNKTPSIFNNIELNKTYCVVLTPIGNGLINVNLKVPLEKQGPLMDKMIVTLKHLPKLLLFTIYNLQHDFITRYTAWRRRVNMIEECFTNGFNEKQSNITDILFMNINDKDMKLGA